MYVGPLSGKKRRESTCRGHYIPLAGEGARGLLFRVGQEPGTRNSEVRQGALLRVTGSVIALTQEAVWQIRPDSESEGELGGSPLALSEPSV